MECQSNKHSLSVFPNKHTTLSLVHSTFNLQLVGEKEAGEDVRPLDSSGYLAIPPSAAEGDTNSQEGNQQSFITYQDHVGGMNIGTAFGSILVPTSGPHFRSPLPVPTSGPHYRSLLLVPTSGPLLFKVRFS